MISKYGPLSHGIGTWFGAVLLVVVLGLPHSDARAASAAEIDAEVNDVMKRFYREVGSAKELGAKAEAVLTFPSVIKAGFGIGGEYGEGALRIDGRTVDYYSTAAASIGFQIGVQSRAVILMFMTDAALKQFQASDGWEAGVDASIALIEIGASGSIDTSNVKDAIVGFIFGEKGLMYNLSLEGSKMTKLDRK